MALAQTVGQVAPTTIANHPYRVLGSYRLLLATLVLLSHTFNMVVGEISKYALGNVGVMLFFVVSGFVIFEALDLFYRDRTPQFLVNRAFKIYPAYWTATIAMYVLHSIFAVSHLEGVPPLQFSPWGIFVNVTLLPAYFKWGNNLPVISLAWAVLVECQFYIMAAALVALARRLPASNAVLAAAGWLALLGYLYVFATHSYTRFFSHFQFAPFFVLGSALYFAETRRTRLPMLLAGVALLLSLHAYFDYNLRGNIRQKEIDWAAGLPWPVIASTLMYATGVALLLALLRCRVGSAAEWWDKRLGDLTYAIYMIHLPIIPVISLIGLSPWPTFLIIVTLTILSAIAIQHYVERPLTRIRNRLRGRDLYG